MTGATLGPSARGATSPRPPPTTAAPFLGCLILLGVGTAACVPEELAGPAPPPPPPPPAPPPAPTTFSLDPGDVQVLDGGDELRSAILAGGDGPRDYLLVPHDTGLSHGTITLRLRVTGEAAAAATTVEAGSSRSRPAVRKRRGAERDLTFRERALIGEWRLRRRVRRELRRRGARPAPRENADSDRLRAARRALAVPGEEDTVRFDFGVGPDLSLSCDGGAEEVVAVVKEVGERVALAEDTAVTRAGGFSPADYEELGRELDDFVFPVDSAYWGPPSDLDGNGRVLVLITAEVNELNDPDADAILAGTFTPNDLADEEDCPVSNEAEVVYVLAPDPDGEFTLRMPVPRAKRIVRLLVSHELQHLLTAAQRIFEGGFAALEETWLSEGYAHIAEEAVGLAQGGLATRRNHRFADVAATPEERDLFETFLQTKFTMLGLHMAEPGETPAFGTSAGRDPLGVESLKMRGNAWAFLRWLADRYAPESPEGVVAGSGEERFFRALSEGGRGVSNILGRVAEFSGASPDWPELLSAYEAMLATDDAADSENLPTGFRTSTWNLRGLYEDLHEAGVEGDRDFGGTPDPFASPYPLAVEELGLAPTLEETVELDLGAFTAAYFRITTEEATVPDLFLEFTDAGGGNPPGDLQVTVVRTR